MPDTAQFKTFGPFYRNGELVTAPRIYHYAAGTTTLKDAWTDRAKAVTAAQPILGDVNGVASGFFDGVYKIQVRLADDATVLFTWDNFDMTEGLHRIQSTELIPEISMADLEAYQSPTIEVPGVVFGNKVFVEPPAGNALIGVLCSAAVEAADNIHFNLYNVSGGAKVIAEGTWTILVLQA